MNEKILEKLKDETGYDTSKCKIIKNIIDSRFIIGKNNREKIINDFINDLSINSEEASELYNTCVAILGNQFRKKIKHPFKSKK